MKRYILQHLARDPRCLGRSRRPDVLPPHAVPAVSHDQRRRKLDVHLYGSGLPMVVVSDLYMPTDGSYLRVSTYGRGVWEIRF